MTGAFKRVSGFKDGPDAVETSSAPSLRSFTIYRKGFESARFFINFLAIYRKIYTMFDPTKDYIHEYQTVCAFTQDYEGEYYHEPWVSAVRENSQVDYNKALKMSVEEMIAAGYAEIKQDGTRKLPGTETNYQIIQIHTNCPVKLENITDFDTWLTSATTFVWREPLPNGWDPDDLAEKYSGTTLARPIMPEMFPCVDLSDVDELSLSFDGGGYQYTHSSIVSERFDEGHDYYSGVTFKTPKHLTVTIRGDYGSVMQANFSMLDTTTGITINCGILSCHDVTGMFEHDVELVNLEINGSFRWDAWRTCHLAFDQCHKLVSIPYVVGWGRDSDYNTIYPGNDGVRGTADCAGLFNASGLTFIGPRLNMRRISISGCITEEYYWNGSAMVTSSITQSPLSYGGRNLYNCPNCTDVRIINLNNNDWNFADSSTRTYLPSMNVASIEYLLNNVMDCSSDPHTVTFKNTYQNQVSSSAISAAAAKGWTVAWQA